MDYRFESRHVSFWVALQTLVVLLFVAAVVNSDAGAEDVMVAADEDHLAVEAVHGPNFRRVPEVCGEESSCSPTK
jgi:hypothetical protein